MFIYTFNMIKLFIIFLMCFSNKATQLLGLGQVFHGDKNLSNQNYLKKIQIYWNVPTFMCHHHKIYFNQLFENFGIIQNFNDNFVGDKIAILYDPGIFPALLKTPNGLLQIRNGGIPQEGNLQKHLDTFKINIQEQINFNFSGLGIIDFESWRPIFRQNWGNLAHYRNYSYKIEKQRFPYLDDKKIKRLASKRFEDFGRIFMEETIKLAKELRPNAYWSYYGYPQCFNLTPKQPNIQCDNQLIKENDEMSWLWKQENMLVPSIYFPIKFDINKKIGLISGRLNEALRISKKFNPYSKILPYFWYKYRDDQEIFLSYVDLLNGFQEILNKNIDGFIIWGSSNDVNTKEKCYKLQNYLNQILGPIVKKIINTVAN